jgi:hypothetical protein
MYFFRLYKGVPENRMPHNPLFIIIITPVVKLLFICFFFGGKYAKLLEVGNAKNSGWPRWFVFLLVPETALLQLRPQVVANEIALLFGTVQTSTCEGTLQVPMNSRAKVCTVKS